MGNTITYEFEYDEDDEDFLSDDSEGGGVHISLGSMLQEVVNQETNEMPPVIRKRPDLTVFRHTMMYKEIKALSGLPANSKRPNERWCLARRLMKRENGLAGFPSGSFTSNQHRRIANLFVPNKKVERLMSLDSKIYVCKFNHDGSRLITASQDATVRIFDASRGTYHRIKRLKVRDVNWSILDVDFSPCGRFFAYSTWTDSFRVLPIDSDGGNDCQSYGLGIERYQAGMFSVRFSPCDRGRTLIGGCNDSHIYICNRETRHVSSLRTQSSSSVDINAVSYISDLDPNLIVSGCNNGILKLWDLRCCGGNDYRSAKCQSTFLGHFDGITYIDPRKDGNYVLSNSRDQSIKIWDLRHPTPNSKVRKHPNRPLIEWDYRFSQVPREYYNPKKTLEGDVSVMTYRGHRVTKTLLRAKFSPSFQTGQRYIYTGCTTGRIIIYDVLTGQIKEAIESHKLPIRDLDWHPIRSELISSSLDAHVNLNMYKKKPNIIRRGSDHMQPLRRSRRIAHRKGELDEEGEDEDEDVGF
ncbi:DDB1- and CUL4-associated factor 11 [Haematobia irritans]|uniref:DDB1- and CUL4-associated factor 11 n=1 Tax=Haematobia irritans TaxID=7368 RepID=UPI003F4FAF75